MTVCLLRLSAFLEAIQVAGGLHAHHLKTLLQAEGRDRFLESWVCLEESRLLLLATCVVLPFTKCMSLFLPNLMHDCLQPSKPLFLGLLMT